MVRIDGYDNWDKRGRSVSMVGEKKVKMGREIKNVRQGCRNNSPPSVQVVAERKERCFICDLMAVTSASYRGPCLPSSHCSYAQVRRPPV